MNGPARAALYAPRDSAAAEFARGLAWLWQLGPVEEAPSPGAVGIGMPADEPRLGELLRSGELAGAIVLAGDAGPATAAIPERVRTAGVPRFSGGTRVRGEYTTFSGGEPVVGSSLGAHAVLSGRAKGNGAGMLVVGIDPDRDWGRMDAFWAFEAIASYLQDNLGRPLRKLPPIGLLRLDDTPGAGHLQLQGRAKADPRQRRRLGALSERLLAAGAVLNVAVVANALEDGERVPLERVWPGAVEVLRAGIERGAFEPICHGLLHLDPHALARSEVDHREFQDLDAEQARAHIVAALAWQAEQLAAPETFVAPGWAYGPAADAVAAELGLIRWDRPRPGPLLEDGRLYESLIGELYGIHRLDFSPLTRLAAVGFPPVIAMHGALLDARIQGLDLPRDAITLARLFVKRDVNRLIGVQGIRWVGAGELVDELRRHGEPASPNGA